MTYQADVVVIGGGVMGTACTYYLAKAGCQVLLVEQEDLAAGTSSACDGFVILQTKSPGLHLKLALKSAAMYKELGEELGHDLEYNPSGGMVVVERPEELPVMEKFMARQQATGLDVELLTGKGARELEPALGEHIVGATRSNLDAQVNPLNVVFGFTQAARRLGAQFLLGAKVQGITVQGGKVTAVQTSKGTISTPVVVNATGVWAPKIGAMVGLEVPITPRRGQLVVTERVPPMVNHILNCARYIAAKYNPELLANNPDPSVALGVGLALEQTATGGFLIGSTREFVGYNRQTTPQGITAILQHACRIVPPLKQVHMIRTFAGLRPYTPDSLPILGPVPGVEGFVMAAGHEGDGIALAPVTGLLVSQLLTTGTTELSIEELGLTRFSGTGEGKKG